MKRITKRKVFLIHILSLFIFSLIGFNNSYAGLTHTVRIAIITPERIIAEDSDDITNYAEDTDSGVEPEVNTVYVSKIDTGTVDITVDPVPPVSEAELPTDWELEKVSGSLDFDGVPGKLSASVSKDTVGDITVKVTAYSGYTDHFQVRIVVVEVDIDTDSDNNGTIDDTDDTIEENAPGKIVLYNDDDDNGNAIEDLTEIGTVAGENNLSIAQLSYDNLLMPDGYNITLETSAGGGNIKVWESATKGIEISLPESYVIGVDTVPTEIYIEGVGTGESMLDMVLKTDMDVELCRDKIKFTVVQIEIDNPHDSPVTNPQDNINEFTFNNAGPGVLTIACEATATPDTVQIRNYLENNRIRWTIDAVGSSTLTWSTAWTADTTKGEGLTTTATFTNLPANNGDFGDKTVTMEVIIDGNPHITKETDIEVFFDKLATNHPGGEAGSPNWYHYWNQVIGSANTIYEAGAGYAEVKGMTMWSYTAAPDKTNIYVHDAVATTHIGCAILGIGPWTGIDLYSNAYLHEQHHTVQITNADAVVGTAAGTPWRHGWSWNVGAHNHWAVGADAQPGAATVDDDGDGTVDNHIVTGPGELGNGDDVRLDATVNHWPDAWGAPPTAPWCQGHPIEHKCYQVMTGIEHALADQDWGNPGKQHATANNYND